MKTAIFLPCLFLLSACGSEDAPVAPDAPASSTGSHIPKTNAAEGTASIATYVLPFDMPAMPNTRYLHGSSKFSRGTKKRGGEHTTSISYYGKPADIVAFYAKAATDRGFENNGGNFLGEGSASIEATNAKGEKFHVYAILGHSKAEKGEARATLVAAKAKPSE